MHGPDSAARDVLRLWVKKGHTRIEPSADGTRLDRYLACRFTYRSRTQWRKLIRAGCITVNDACVRPSRVLRQGDAINYIPFPREEPPIDRRTQILFLDAHLVGVAKSGNVPIHPSGRYFRHTLLHILATEHPEWGNLRVVHRLDRETSGIVIFGRDREATEHLAVQFRRREVQKRYLALVEGRPPKARFVIDRPLGKAKGSRIRKAVGIQEDGISAHTDVRVLHQGDGWAWVEARPRTGRLHQIRVHLQSAGLPILGDKVYGRDERFFLKFINNEPLTPEESALLGLPRQALHAYQLVIRHPASGERLSLTAPLPEDMAQALLERGLDPAPWQQRGDMPGDDMTG
ncbi:MAG: RluA family pseudouridine synthase [Candidatus Eisenbacteria sp.]|nr:RluA family pseudouridine synthase [Candidatus Eisenbacteria bacterium]